MTYTREEWSLLSDEQRGPCLEWAGYIERRGYGMHKTKEHRDQLVHRVVWAETHGPIPDGLFVCHHCDNPPCYRLSHLFLGTPKDNMVDKMEKGRGVFHRGEAHHNSKLTEENVQYIRSHGVKGHHGNVSALAAEFGVNTESIRRILNGTRWR